MKIVIAPGAFKHSLTARQAAEAIARGLRESALAAELLLLPIADGGNGTLDAFLAAGGQRITVKTTDALGRPLLAEIGLLPDAQETIRGHRDLVDTTCPGDGLYGLLPAIRERVRGLCGY